MNLLENLLPFLFAFLAGHCVFLALVLIVRISRPSSVLLGILLLLLLVRVGKSVLSLAIPDSALAINIVGIVAMASIGPILWIYIKSMFQSSPLGRSVLSISLLPALLAIFLWSWRWLNLAYYLITLHLFFYIVMAAVHMFRNREAFKADNMRFKWSASLLIAFLVLWITFALQLFTYDRVLYLIIVLSSIVLSYGLSLWAFSQQKLFIGERRKKETDPEDYEAIRASIEQLMQQEIYVDPLLNLTLLAKSLNKQPYLVSRVINDQFNKTFPELLLHYRIKKAEELLLSSLNKTYTVEGIAYESGFSTLSAFYTAFKKETGMTPTQYKKRRTADNMRIA